MYTRRDDAWHDALCNTYGELIVRMLVRQLNGDMSVARDLAQETFITAWQKREAVPDDPLGWLYTTAKYHLSNHRRAAKRHEYEPLDGYDAVDASAMLPLAVIDENHRLESLLRQLNSKDREILELTYLDELTPEQIAAALAITPSAARQRLSRARRQLQKVITQSPSNTEQQRHSP